MGSAIEDGLPSPATVGVLAEFFLGTSFQEVL